MNKIAIVLQKIIFMSRWIQAPLYLGLILTLIVYVYEFAIGIFQLFTHLFSLTDTQIMLGVLDLIDVVMVANLLIMVIIGGYEIFVSKLNLDHHPDKPEWFSKVDSGMMKVKVALALVSISSIHLLRTFFSVSTMSNMAIMWQILIHLSLLVSVLTIALTNKLTTNKYRAMST